MSEADHHFEEMRVRDEFMTIDGRRCRVLSRLPDDGAQDTESELLARAVALDFDAGEP